MVENYRQEPDTAADFDSLQKFFFLSDKMGEVDSKRGLASNDLKLNTEGHK